MLVALWDVSNQFNDNNGSILTNGKVYVYYSGRAALAPTWSSADGSHVNSNPIILDNNGRAVAFADDQYTYTCVVCDFYGRELFSFDPASFGTGGGGSTTEGNDAAHWIGATGTDVQVTALADTLLPLPSSPDYEGDFVSQTTYTTISLNKGLYMVDADIRIQQDDDLENIIKDISVYTGLTGQDSLITSQKNWTGPEASDDRHFVHVHFIRHVADEGEDIYFQMNSPVDLSSAWIDKLSIVKLTEGGNGKSYVGGYGIDITGPVISVSGMIPEASAANFVDVSTYNTDIENIYDTIAETSAMIPSGVATEQWVEDFTSAFITEDALNGYATEQWVEDQHYITSADIPPIPQDVVTSGELATVSGDIVSQIPSLDGYATQQWVGEQGYLTEIPSEYVTDTEMENYTSAFITSADLPSLDGYATEQFVEDYTSAFITSADVPHFTQEQADWNEDDQSAPDYIKNKPTIPSIEGLASEQYVQDYTSAFITSADIPDVPEDLVTSAQLATVSGDIVNQIPDVSDMATQTWVNEQGFLTSVPAEYATSGDLVTLSGAIENEIPNYTAGDNISIVNDEISVSGTAGLIAGDNISITSSGDSYVISSSGGEVPADLVTSGQLATVSGNIMNEIPDTSDMATKTWVGQQGYLTSVPDDLVTSGELATVSGDIMSQIPSQTTVSIDPTLSSGTKIAEFNINGTSGELFAPQGGGGSDIFLVVRGSTTFDEIFAAHTAGKAVFLYYADSSQGYLVPLTVVYKSASPSSSYALFVGPPTSTSSNRLTKFVASQISGQNRWTDPDIFTLPKPANSAVGKVLSCTGTGGAIGWVDPAAGSEVDIIPSLQTGTKIADYVIDGTSGMLYAPDGGGEITYPLVYESSNPEEDNIMTSAVLIVDDNGIAKNIMTTSPYEIVISREIPSIHSIARTTIDYNGIHLENEYDDEYIYTNDVIAWNNTKNAVINSANKWNSAYNAINDSASYWNDAAGMNEYPISAGPGMSIEDVSGVTVFSTDEITAGTGIKVTTPAAGQIQVAADETVLWENTSAYPAVSSITLSENFNNFEFIEVSIVDLYGWGTTTNLFYTPGVSKSGSRTKRFATSNIFSLDNNGTLTTYLRTVVLEFANNEYKNGSVTGFETRITASTNYVGSGGTVLGKITGIHRISGGN